jgi:hypothetical protein
VEIPDLDNAVGEGQIQVACLQHFEELQALLI